MISPYSKYISVKTDNNHGCKNKYCVSIDFTQGQSLKAKVKKSSFTNDLYNLYMDYKGTMFKSVMFDYLAELCESKFKKQKSRDIIFTNSCMSYEIKEHLLGLFYHLSYKSIKKPVLFTTYNKESLGSHCRSVEISEADVYDLKQSVGFGYFNGIRDKYKGTANDPYYYSNFTALKNQ